ncbi:putative flagellar protofilament ribbon protein rib74 [Blattamonas nauphoetae]|uniref:Flagellar protofilament ribbon protein rib74 n=1 Tax=Blattamonas nauphoetae TaxID=2049346 RepID=A0ABQ9XL54_9EUKA|nr:putative flagellar protofilament ribbon protein rib74 [Blattamonas nauphoetae]
MTTIRPDDVPFLPGYRVMNQREQNFAKSHVFDRNLKTGSREVKLDAPGIGGTLLPGQVPKATHTTRSIMANAAIEGAESTGEHTPAFIAFDRKVLRFFAYFQEGVAETRLETQRFRKVKIYCYLEDDSMQINEFRQDNSGIPQGTRVRRHQFPKPGEIGIVYHWDDLDIGIDVEIYGVVYHIVDADEFTKNFFRKTGRQLSEPEPWPVDVWEENAAATKPRARQTTTKDPDKQALRQFILNDRKVLRFFCVWDDRNEAYGDLRQFVLQYYLSDDTIQVNEVKKNNSGYASFSTFIRRQRVPRRFVGETTSINKDQALNASDLMVGWTVNVFNRPLFLYDCDAFTKKFYREVFGVTEFEQIELPSVELIMPTAEIPPYLGIGSEEDTMQNVRSLIPKPAKKDFPRQIAFEGVVFRYKARFLNAAAQDSSRRFIFSVYPTDDTIAIFEPLDRNSGTTNGKFLQRGKYKREDGSDTYILTQEVHVGDTIPMLGKQILIIDADDFTLHYKLGHRVPDQLVDLPMLSGYPVRPNIEEALKHVKRTILDSGKDVRRFAQECRDNQDATCVSLQTVRKKLNDMQIEPNENTLLGLIDQFDRDIIGRCPMNEFIQILEDILA